MSKAIDNNDLIYDSVCPNTRDKPTLENLSTKNWAYKSTESALALKKPCIGSVDKS